MQELKKAISARRAPFLALVLCMLVCAAAAYTRGQYSFNTWTTETGLPQNSVYDILQTRDGYLWLATFGGLVRYDGVRFTVFTTGNSSGIKSSRFTKLLEDREGSLWAMTEASGLTRYKAGTFTTFTSKDGLPHDQISEISLRDDARGGLALRTQAGPVRWVDGSFIPFEPGEGELFPDAGYPANTGAVWHLDGDELVRVFAGQVTERVPAAGLEDPTIQDSEIRAVYETRDGGVWFAALNGTVRRYGGGRFEDYNLTSGKPRDFVQIIREDREGNLWFGLSRSGVVRLRNGSLSRFTRDQGLLADEVDAILEDTEGGLWFGTPNGLCRFRERIITTHSEKDGLANKNVYPIYQDRAGTIWIGSWPGLTRYENGAFTLDRTPGGPSNNFVTALWEDAGGTLWVGTWGQGIKLLRDGRSRTLTTQDGLADDIVRAIYEDRSGAMWIGTAGGLTRFRDGVWTVFRVEDGLPGNVIIRIFEDREGTLWIGTEMGLTRYRDGAFTTIGEKEGLSGYLVRAIHEDADGVLWVGTYDAGLNRLANGRVTNYTTKNGLFDNGVHQILDDERGNFWISSNLGVYRVARQELNDFAEGKLRSITSVSYGSQDGMLNAECNGGGHPAGIVARDGRLWFPTQDGAAVIDPAEIGTNAIVPPVLVEEIMRDGELLAPGANLEFPAGAVDLQIKYTALSFTRPELVRFRYRLEGLDGDWVDAGARRTAYYSYIPPGSYTFRVVAANSSGVWNTDGASIDVTVHPPYWRTWWFVSLAALELIGVALLIHRLRIERLKRRHAVQEAFTREIIRSQEHERKRIATELHDSLGQNLLVIKNRALMGLGAQNGSTEEQLDVISSTASMAIDEVREIASNLHPYQIERLGLGKAIESMLKRVASASKIKLRASIDPIDGFFSGEEEINFFRIVQECINNVVKHSAAEMATVSVRRNASGLALTFEDDGKGFSMEAAGTGRQGGWGLIGIQERARILGGICRIHSAPGAGTIVRVDFSTEGGHDANERRVAGTDR